MLLVGKPEGKRPLRRPRGRWVGRWILERQDGAVLTELIWFTVTNGGSCECGNEPSGSIKCQESH
jgi:hypothetical protein